MKQTLCKPCAMELASRGKVLKPLEFRAEKITCAACGRRRYGVQYEVLSRARRETIKAAVLLSGWLVIAVTAEAWATPISQAITPDWLKRPPADLVVAVPADPIPIIQVTAPLPEPSEASNEDALIEAALLEQGYYSDEIPLDYLYQDILRTACEQYGVPYALALAVIETESGFDLEAVGADGRDVGLFQIRTSNHAWLSEETGADPAAPAGNIVCGVWLLGHLLGEYGNAESALTAYRWGQDNGSRDYARTVLAAAERWAERTGLKNG
ncbi:MAG: lytic transglycosylase domain-containing protein [Oscillospiraceae bacterium]|nr:lytic transglycosylase domain-containing protein [Oscillospiraceae bacterium]